MQHFEHIGKGYCPSGYYKGNMDDADHATMTTKKCAILCNEEPECLYFAVKPLATCSRYNSVAGDCPTNGAQDHELYKKSGRYRVHFILTTVVGRLNGKVFNPRND